MARAEEKAMMDFFHQILFEGFLTCTCLLKHMLRQMTFSKNHPVEDFDKVYVYSTNGKVNIEELKEVAQGKMGITAKVHN